MDLPSRLGSVGERLAEKLRAGTAVVAVIGAGYVGLPLALAFVRAGHRVCLVDVDDAKIAALRKGTSYIRDIPDEAVRAAQTTGRLDAVMDPAVLREADVIFICVPTPFTVHKEPDTSHIERAAQDIAEHIRPGQLVILRSTSYPGTTDQLLRPIIERGGHRVGDDVYLAFAPERIDPGNRRHTMHEVPIVVGGCDPVSSSLAAQALGRIAQSVVRVASPAAAEMTKLLENVFRNVNIALVNQIAQLCERMGLDVWEIVDAAATKPYGFMSFAPGLVGGHCIPVDPYYLAWKARAYDFHMDFIELAARVNEEMPYYVVNRLLAALHRNGQMRDRRRVLLLGVAFKRDVDDARHAPSVRVIELLRRQEVDVSYHDPYVPVLHLDGATLRSVVLTPEELGDADCVVILTDHTSVDYEGVVAGARLVFDTRNATRAVQHHREKILLL